MTDDLQELANKAATLAVLKRIVAALDAEVRESLQMTLAPGDRKSARIGDYAIGSAVLTDPKGSYRVTNGGAWRAWVKEHRPGEIVTVESVRSSFESAMLATGCDDNGEPLPGVEWVPGTSVLQVRTEPDAEARIRAELAANGLSFAQVLDSFSPQAVEA